MVIEIIVSNLSLKCAFVVKVKIIQMNKKRRTTMSKMNKYMMVHNTPGVDCKEVQSNWRKLVDVEAGTWIRTYFNEEKGVRYCLWMAQSEEDLKNIFTEIGIIWDSIIQVEETIPDLWGEKWNEHLEKDAVADTLGS
jgi:predicted butyrate kinase (DUF1464 family)